MVKEPKSQRVKSRNSQESQRAKEPKSQRAKEPKSQRAEERRAGRGKERRAKNEERRAKSKMFYYKRKLTKAAGLALFLFFVWPAAGVFSKEDIEGSARARLAWPPAQSGFSSAQGRLSLKGEVYFNNKLKAQALLLAANPYRPISPLKRWLKAPFMDFFKIYPSGRWLISEDMELKLGRNLYENEFHQIVSINSYEPFFYSFDGAILEYSAPAITARFWGASLPENWIGLEQAQELKYGFGFFLDIESISDYIDSFNIHTAYLGDSFFDERAKKMSRYGLGMKGTISPVAYTFVAVGHGQGVRFKLEESMYHFRLSYSRPDFFNSEIFAGYHTDSAKYQPWLYNRHKSAGRMDIFSWGNLTYYFLGLSCSAGSWFDISIAFYDFDSTEKGLMRAGWFGSLLNLDNERFLGRERQGLGREMDIQIKRRLSESFKVRLLAGIFVPHSKSESLFNHEDFYSNVQLTGFYDF